MAVLNDLTVRWE